MPEPSQLQVDIPEQLIAEPEASDDLDLSLALAARNGSRQARNALYLSMRDLISKLTARVRSLADGLYLMGGPINGEDVEQQCFVIFCDLITSWDPDRALFATYLRESLPQAAYAYVRDMQHLRSTRTRLVSVRSLLHPDSYGSRGDPDDTLKRRQSAFAERDSSLGIFNERLWQTVAGQLQLDCAYVVRQRFWEDKSSDYIAEQLGCSTRTVNRALQSALPILQAVIRDWLKR